MLFLVWPSLDLSKFHVCFCLLKLILPVVILLFQGRNEKYMRMTRWSVHCHGFNLHDPLVGTGGYKGMAGFCNWHRPLPNSGKYTSESSIVDPNRRCQVIFHPKPLSVPRASNRLLGVGVLVSFWHKANMCISWKDGGSEDTDRLSSYVFRLGGKDWKKQVENESNFPIQMCFRQEPTSFQV